MNQLKEKLQEFWKKVQKFFANMYTETPNKEKKEESSWSSGDIFATSLRTLKLLWDVMIALVICLFLFGAGIGIGYAASLFNNVKAPKTEELVQQVRNVSSVSKLTYSDKSLISEVDSDLIRTPVAGDAISDNVKKAVIATEDENFESHKGVVPKAVLRATLGSVAGVGSSSGGSTLTQQLIKQQVVGDAPTFTRKATEIVDALALERGMDKNEILTNVFRSKGVLVGTSTMNNVMMPKIAGLVEEMTGLRFRNKRASAFGSHGWSGGAVDRLSTRLQDAGFEMSLSLKAKWRPDQDALELCREHGREIARQWALAPLPQSTVNTVVKEETSANTTADLGPRMQCSVCQWIYDPAKGEPMQDVAPGTPWSEVPDNFLCPECSLGKDVFDELASEAK